MLVFPKCWDLEMFIWKFLLEKTRKSLSGSGFPPKSVHAVEGPKTRNLLSRVPHLVFFPREKNPSFGGKKLSTQNQVLYRPPAVGAPETERVT